MKNTRWAEDSLRFGVKGSFRELLRDYEPGVDNPNVQAQLKTYIIDCPTEGYPWRSYIAGLCHLRDVPGGEPMTLEFPEATHELLILALSHEKEYEELGPNDGDGMVPVWPMYFLTPPNVACQFHCCAAEADQVLIGVFDKLIQAVIDGNMELEPGDRHQTFVWRATANALIDRELMLLGYPEGGH